MVNFSVFDFQKELKESTIGHSTIAEFLCWWIHIIFFGYQSFFPEKHHPSANPNGAALLGRSRGALGLYQGS
jgi:hypothetical protein